MASKVQYSREIEVYCSELGRYAYDVLRVDRTDYGKLRPKPGSPHQSTEGVVDAIGAFAAWMRVLSRYRDWKEARDAVRLLQLRADGEPIGDELARWCRLAARPLTRRATELDKALRAAAEEYGDLGVGQDVEVIANKLIALQNFITFDALLRELYESGHPRNEPPPEEFVEALQRDGLPWQAAVRELFKVSASVEAISHKFHKGRLVVHATTMFEAITIGAAMLVRPSDRYLRVCQACSTLFVAKHPKAETCSPRCRQRKRG